METMIRLQNMSHLPSENSYPDNLVGDSTRAASARPEHLINVDSIAWDSVQTGAQNADSVAPGDAQFTDVSMAGTGNSVVTPSPVALIASGKTLDPYHGTSPLETQSVTDAGHQPCLSNRSNMHPPTTDAEASVLAPQVVREILQSF